MNGMTCRELVELVTDYLDGVLSPDAAERFADHLAICDGCERYLDQFRMVAGELGEAVATEPPLDLPGDVRDKLLIAFRDWPL